MVSKEELLAFGFGNTNDHELGIYINNGFWIYYDYHFNKVFIELDISNVVYPLPHIKTFNQIKDLYYLLGGNKNP